MTHSEQKYTQQGGLCEKMKAEGLSEAIGTRAWEGAAAREKWIVRQHLASQRGLCWEQSCRWQSLSRMLPEHTHPAPALLSGFQ